MSFEEKRSRSEGWEKAKYEGHLNEDSFTQENVSSEILSILDEDEHIVSIGGGGSNELKVVTLFGYKAPSKTDKVILTNKRSITISLKKSDGGQVYLIPSDKFFSGFEIWYNREVPSEVGEIITLFTGESDDVENVLQDEMVMKQNMQVSPSQRTRRLCFDALDVYDSSKVSKTLEWFRENIGLITDYVFSRGLSDDSHQFAEYLYYKNFLDEDNSMDKVFKISELADLCQQNSHMVEFGQRYGRTSIQLPFGHVQMHQDTLQFHHSYSKILGLFVVNNI